MALLTHISRKHLDSLALLPFLVSSRKGLVTIQERKSILKSRYRASVSDIHQHQLLTIQCSQYIFGQPLIKRTGMMIFFKKSLVIACILSVVLFSSVHGSRRLDTLSNRDSSLGNLDFGHCPLQSLKDKDLFSRQLFWQKNLAFVWTDLINLSNSWRNFGELLSCNMKFLILLNFLNFPIKSPVSSVR